MLPSHARALADLCACRTPALGGSLFACEEACGHFEFSYHSCRNRRYPKCHCDRTRRWLAGLLARLLPCPYYLATFTLPAELRPLARFLQHVLPKGFPKVRSYGLLAPRTTARRESARELLALDPATPCPKTAAPPQPGAAETPKRPRPCPACHRGHLVRIVCSHVPFPFTPPAPRVSSRALPS